MRTRQMAADTNRWASCARFPSSNAIGKAAHFTLRWSKHRPRSGSVDDGDRDNRVAARTTARWPRVGPAAPWKAKNGIPAEIEPSPTLTQLKAKLPPAREGRPAMEDVLQLFSEGDAGFYEFLTTEGQP
jgi:hypothetical protein